MTSKITPQPSIEQVEIETFNRSQSESTFTRHTKSIHAIIKEVMLGLICMLQLYLTLKLSKT